MLRGHLIFNILLWHHISQIVQLVSFHQFSILRIILEQNIEMLISFCKTKYFFFIIEKSLLVCFIFRLTSYSHNFPGQSWPLNNRTRLISSRSGIDFNIYHDDVTLTANVNVSILSFIFKPNFFLYYCHIIFLLLDLIIQSISLFLVYIREYLKLFTHTIFSINIFVIFSIHSAF